MRSAGLRPPPQRQAAAKRVSTRMKGSSMRSITHSTGLLSDGVPANPRRIGHVPKEVSGADSAMAICPITGQFHSDTLNQRNDERTGKAGCHGRYQGTNTQGHSRDSLRSIVRLSASRRCRTKAAVVEREPDEPAAAGGGNPWARMKPSGERLSRKKTAEGAGRTCSQQMRAERSGTQD
jgi:hypothetical protein